MRGYSISYIPWESQLSGEVGGYPQALMKVVNLQGMLDFRRNFLEGMKFFITSGKLWLKMRRMSIILFVLHFFASRLRLTRRMDVI